MKKCIICNYNKFVLKYKNTLMMCEECKFITANLDVTDSLLKNIYTENYFKGEEYLDYLKDKIILQRNFKSRLMHILKYVDKKNILSAVEVGCAYGFFAEEFTSEIKDAKYIGFDIVPEPIEYGKNVLKQNLKQQDFINYPVLEPYTDVFLWDVIEHLPNPDQIISKIGKEIKTGGRIYITTGDISALLPKLQKHKWRMIHPPSHLHYFSKKTLTKLLNKHGFEIINISYPPIYRSLKQIYYSLFLLKKNESPLKNWIYNRIPDKMFIPINTYDIMFVIGKKVKNCPATDL